MKRVRFLTIIQKWPFLSYVIVTANERCVYHILMNKLILIITFLKFYLLKFSFQNDLKIDYSIYLSTYLSISLSIYLRFVYRQF